MMFLLEEIVVEVAMIAAVTVAVLCLAYLTQLSVREQLHLRRLRRERAHFGSVRVDSTPREGRRPANGSQRRDRAHTLHEKHG